MITAKNPRADHEEPSNRKNPSTFCWACVVSSNHRDDKESSLKYKMLKGKNINLTQDIANTYKILLLAKARMKKLRHELFR